MSYIQYENWRPDASSLRIVQIADQIAREYSAQGYDLTLRQLYYQFVARDILPNTERSYKNLGSMVQRGRMAGLIDWELITDRTRNMTQLARWDSPAHIIESISTQFRVDYWADQPTRVEVWVEKEALAGVVKRAADAYGCPWLSCRGYMSASEMKVSADRLVEHIKGGQRVVILHLGDHDPSGIDMTRDITDRLTLFVYGDLAEHLGLPGPCDEYDERSLNRWDPDDVIEEVKQQLLDNGEDTWSDPFEVNRIALNLDQVQQYNPPPNPAKLSDSRATGYVERFGNSSWELDALDPATLNALITTTIDGIVDQELYDARRELVTNGRALIKATSDKWAEVAEFVQAE